MDIVNIVVDVSALNWFSILKTVFIVIAMPFTVIIRSPSLYVFETVEQVKFCTPSHTLHSTLWWKSPQTSHQENRNVFFLDQQQSTVLLFGSHYFVNCSSAVFLDGRPPPPSQFKGPLNCYAYADLPVRLQGNPISRLLWGRFCVSVALTVFFIARQHTDARYWYSKSVSLYVYLPVCPVLDENGLTYCDSFFSPYGSPIILALPASNIFTKFRRGHPMRSAKYRWGVQISWISTNKSLYLPYDTRQRHTKSYKWYHFQWLWVTSNPHFKVTIIFNAK